jgi:elongation factor Ts
MKINAEMVKELREATGAPIMDCKAALVEADGDFDEAVKKLRTKGLAEAKKRASRETKEGNVFSYIHLNGKIGVLVEINCETDFVAKTPDFQELGKNIAMQIAALNPLHIEREQVSKERVEAEREIYRLQAKEAGKPERVWDRIVDGRLEKFFKEVCLLEQSFIKQPEITVKKYIAGVAAKLRENITIRRFVRYEVGR